MEILSDSTVRDRLKKKIIQGQQNIIKLPIQAIIFNIPWVGNKYLAQCSGGDNLHCNDHQPLDLLYRWFWGPLKKDFHTTQGHFFIVSEIHVGRPYIQIVYLLIVLYSYIFFLFSHFFWRNLYTNSTVFVYILSVLK